MFVQYEKALTILMRVNDNGWVAGPAAQLRHLHQLPDAEVPSNLPVNPEEYTWAFETWLDRQASLKGSFPLVGHPSLIPYASHS